jgi:O-succinylhomoserine sulfhydrylase
MEEVLLPFHRHTGPALSPFNAWMILKGLETLSLRVARHCANAQAISERLAEHKAIKRVHYPGLPEFPQYALAQRQMTHGGPLLAFEVKGGREAAFRFANALKIIDISNNLGDTKSLITHPASTTHASMGPGVRAELGIEEGLLRLSAGIEDKDDLLEDVGRALDILGN